MKLENKEIKVKKTVLTLDCDEAEALQQCLFEHRYDFDQGITFNVPDIEDFMVIIE